MFLRCSTAKRRKSGFAGCFTPFVNFSDYCGVDDGCGISQRNHGGLLSFDFFFSAATCLQA